MDQVRVLLRQPEVIVGTWLAARAEITDLTEDETRASLERLDQLWDQLFPAEQARIIRLLINAWWKLQPRTSGKRLQVRQA